MLSLLPKLLVGLGAAGMLVCFMSPAYVVAVYSVTRPLLQPYAFLQYKMFGFPISLPYTAIIVVLGVMFMVTRSRWRISAQHSLLFSAFIVVALLTTVYSEDLSASYGGLSKLLTGWFLFNIAFNATQSPRDARIMLYGVSLSAVIPMAIGFYQAVTRNYDFLLDATVDRVSGVFGVGNAYGIFLSISLAAAIVLLATSTTNRSRFLLFCLVLALVVSQVLALNRGTWLALALGFVITALKYRKFVQFKWVVVVGAVVIVFFSNTIYERFQDLQEKNTLQERIDFWQATLPLIADKPWTGYGIGSTTAVLQEQLHTSSVPHNDFVRLALETGLIGAGLYLLFLLRLLWFFFSRPLSTQNWQYNFSLLMLIIYVLIISTTQNLVYNLINFPAFLILTAVAVRMNSLSAAEPAAQTKRPAGYAPRLANARPTTHA